MNQLKSNEVLIKGVQSDFRYCSYRQCMQMLDCSKTYIQKLLREGIVTAYYLEKKDGKCSGKPYFNKQEIEEAFMPKEVSIN